MRDVMRIILSLSISGGLLALLVLGISRLFSSRFSKAWHYYIWLLVILRLLLPVAAEVNLIGAAFETAQVAATQTAAPPAAVQRVTSIVTQQASGGEQAAASGIDLRAIGQTLVQWLWVPWLGIALGLLIRKITLYQSFNTYIRAGNTEVDDVETLNRLAEVCEGMGIRRQVRLHVNPLTSTPLMLGFFRPTIVLPSIQLDAGTLRYILLHELTHYRRRDMLYKWLVQLTLCVHWFNPLVHLLAKETQAACELSCDEAVIRHLDAGAQRAYGQVLIESLKNPGRYKQALAGVTLSESAHTVKERLKAIMKYRKMSMGTMALSIVMVICLAMGDVALGSVTPGTPEISFAGRTEAYRLVADMAKVDTGLTLAAYTAKINAICDAAGTNLFEVMADSEIQGPEDPLYAFSTGTLARTSTELYAEHFPENEEPMVFGSAVWERYPTEEEKAAAQGDFSDEEWALFLEATKDDPEYPVAMKAVHYFIYYQVADREALTVAERDERLNAVLDGMQAFMAAMDEEAVYGDGFREVFMAELDRLMAEYAGSGLTMEGEFGSGEGYRDGEEIVFERDS